MASKATTVNTSLSVVEYDGSKPFTKQNNQVANPDEKQKTAVGERKSIPFDIGYIVGFGCGYSPKITTNDIYQEINSSVPCFPTVISNIITGYVGSPVSKESIVVEVVGRLHDVLADAKTYSSNLPIQHYVEKEIVSHAQIIFANAECDEKDSRIWKTKNKYERSRLRDEIVRENGIRDANSFLGKFGLMTKNGRKVILVNKDKFYSALDAESKLVVVALVVVQISKMLNGVKSFNAIRLEAELLPVKVNPFHTNIAENIIKRLSL